MQSKQFTRMLLPVAVALGLLGLVACGPAATAVPTPTKTSAIPAKPTPLPLLPTIAVSTPTSAPATTGSVATPTAAAPTATTVPAEKPVYGGVINKVERAQDGAFDPQNSRAGYSVELGMVGNLYSQLIRVPIDTRNGVEGDLAESWSVAANGTDYTFKIRSGVVDHEGKALTADDVYWNMVRYVAKPNGLAPRRQTCVSEYVKPIWDANKNPIADGGAEIKSPTEVVIRLKGPRAAFIPCVTGGFFMIHGQKYVKAIDTDPSGKNRDLDPNKGELGAEYGPFKYKDSQTDNFFSVVKNDKYFRPGKPYLDGINTYFILDESARVAAFKTGRIDMSCTFTCWTKASAESLMKDIPGLKMSSLVAFGMGAYLLNTRRPAFGPVGDAKADTVRKAINLAVDRDVVNKLAFDGIGFLSTYYYIGWDWINTEAQWRAMPGWAATDKKAPEITEAKKLMEGLGYGPNNKLKIGFLTTAGALPPEAFRTLMEPIYIDVTIQVVDAATSTARQEANDFDVVALSVGVTFVDPDSYNTGAHFLFANGGRNRTGYLSPKWTELYEKQSVLQSEAARAPLLRDMAKILNDDASIIGTIRPAIQQPYRGNWRGHVPPALDSANFSYENVWLAK